MRSSFFTILLIACTACSGGGGSSEGGIGGSGISQGAVTATGSATVAGTEWDLDGADATFDGQPGPAAAVALGMVVTVEGSRSRDGQSGVADRIEFDDSIEGPISQISPDPPAPTDDLLELTILDQTVIVERGFTVFEGTSFDTLGADDLVEVSGYPDANGVISATRVEFLGVLAPGGMPPVELKGSVTNLAGGMFEIGSVDVLFDPTGVATDLSDMPGGAVFEDDFVEVEGTYDPGANEITADRIEPEGEGIAGDVRDFEIEGIVSDCAPPPGGACSSFRVGSQSVLATNLGIEFEPDDAFLVANGLRIEVEGSLEDGVLIADAIKLRGGEARVSAAIPNAACIDLVADTVKLLDDSPDCDGAGITIFVDAGTRLEDDRDGLDPFDLADLAAGDFLEVRGVRIADGVRATELERDDVSDVEVRGRLEAFEGAPNNRFTLLGLEIPTDAGTEYEGFPAGVVDQEAFYQFLAANLGVVLEARDEDAEVTTLDFADQIGLED